MQLIICVNGSGSMNDSNINYIPVGEQIKEAARELY